MDFIIQKDPKNSDLGTEVGGVADRYLTNLGKVMLQNCSEDKRKEKRNMALHG